MVDIRESLRKYFCFLALLKIQFITKRNLCFLRKLAFHQKVLFSKAGFSFFVFVWAVSAFSDSANKVIATIAVGQTPNSIVITPDSRFAYVANNNNTQVPGGDCISVINLLYNTVETTIYDESFNGPYALTMNAEGTKVYAANSNADTVTIIDIATNTVSGVISGFDGPSGFVISADGKKAYVNNYGTPPNVGTGTTVNVVDLTTNTIVGDAIEVGLAPAVMVITPDGLSVYVICYNDGNIGTGFISIISTETNTVRVAAINGLFGPYAAAINASGDYIYVTNFGSNNFTPVGTTLSVVDTKLNAIVDTIFLGIQPAGIGLTPDGLFAYVSNYSSLYDGPSYTNLIYGQGSVNIIDLKNNQVLPSIIGGLGYAPSSISISPNGQRAYVTNFASNTVSVISLPSPLYNINRLTPSYDKQKDESINQLQKAGLK